MKNILAAALFISFLAGCVSAPSELYGIHRIPPEQAAKPKAADDTNKIKNKGTT